MMPSSDRLRLEVGSHSWKRWSRSAGVDLSIYDILWVTSLAYLTLSS